MITIEYNGTERSLAYWGIDEASPQCSHRNLTVSVYTFNIPGADITAAPAFPYRGKIIVRRNRSGSDGAGYSGGYVGFIGYRIEARAYTSGNARGIAYAFVNAWHFFQNMAYQQFYASRNPESEAIEFKRVSQLTLFLEFDDENNLIKKDAGEQIEAVLDYVLTQVATPPFIIGTIDPDLDFPSYEMQEATCEAVILKCLELSPDVVCFFDYSTTLEGVPTPTIHFYNAASRTSLSLAIENGSDHAALNIVPRHDLVPEAVIIFYKVMNSVDGNVSAVYYKDKYGPNGQNSEDDPDGGLDVIMQTINLQGFSASNVTGKLTVQAVDVNNASQTNRKAWWAMFHPEFANGRIRNVTFADATIKNAAGSTVSLATYPNRLLPGSGGLLPWMTVGGGTPVIGEHVEILATVTFDEYDATSGGNLVRGKQIKQVKTTAVITNGLTGDYSATGSFIESETVPGMTGIDEAGNGIFLNGLAKKVYDALSALQYEGEDVRVQAEIVNGAGTGPLISLKNKLNLTGGLAAWTTLSAQIQSITEHDGGGQTSVSFGPRALLSVGGMAELFQFNRLRRVFNNPSVRQSADLGSSSNTVQMPDATPAENSTKALHEAASIAVTYKFTE